MGKKIYLTEEEIIAENSLVTFIGVVKSYKFKTFNPHYATLQVLDFKTFFK